MVARDREPVAESLERTSTTHEVSFVSSGEQTSSLSYSTEFDETGSFGFGQGSGAGYGYTRDTAGRVTQTTSQYCFDSGCPSGPTQTYVYEPTNNRLATLTDADGEHDVTYDARGFVHTITVTHGGTLEGTYTLGYDASGRNTSLQYPDGHQRIQQFDNEGRITSRCYQYTNASQDRCYTAVFDPAGNPTTMTDPGGTDVITYDPLYRVTSVTRQVSGQPDVVETYTYNALGALNGNAASVTGFTLNDQRPLLSGNGTGDSAIMAAVNGTAVSVDPAGHVTSLLGATITVDRQERIVGIATGTANLGYAYDSHHRRVLRSVNGVDEYYQYEGVNLVARLDATGAVEDTWLYDGVDDPLRLQRGALTYYYELDLAGNVRRLRDATGADLGGYRYSAFGVTLPADAATPASAVDQLLRWKGRPFESGAGGVYDMRARWWSPAAGQFLTADRLKYLDGASTLWGWANQNPLRWSDPSGRLPVAPIPPAGPQLTLIPGGAGATAGGAALGIGGLALGTAAVALEIVAATYTILSDIDEFEHPTVYGANPNGSPDTGTSGCPSSSIGPAPETNSPDAGSDSGAPAIYYHYTDVPEQAFSNGFFAGGAVTNDPSYTAAEASQLLGISPPDSVIPIVDTGGYFQYGGVVGATPRYAGGGMQWFAVKRVPPSNILPAQPVAVPGP
jgi:RHS repeat-associated protein